MIPRHPRRVTPLLPCRCFLCRKCPHPLSPQSLTRPRGRPLFSKTPAWGGLSPRRPTDLRPAAVVSVVITGDSGRVPCPSETRRELRVPRGPGRVPPCLPAAGSGLSPAYPHGNPRGREVSTADLKALGTMPIVGEPGTWGLRAEGSLDLNSWRGAFPGDVATAGVRRGVQLLSGAPACSESVLDGRVTPRGLSAFRVPGPCVASRQPGALP